MLNTVALKRVSKAFEKRSQSWPGPNYACLLGLTKSLLNYNSSVTKAERVQENASEGE